MIDVLHIKDIGKILFLLYCVGMIVFMSACRVTKFVPEDKDLLYKVRIKLDDKSLIKESDLLPYLRQKQNTEILGFWKLQLHIYNTAPLDTMSKSKKRLARNAHKMGEKPELYDEKKTVASIDQLEQAMHNLGYFNAVVDTEVVRKERKIYLTYNIHAGEPYYINTYTSDLTQSDLNSFANTRTRYIKNGMRFNAEAIGDERNRIADAMQTTGYYYFDKDFLAFEADSGLLSHKVNLRIKTSDYLENLSDSVKNNKIYVKNIISTVHFHQNYDPIQNSDDIDIVTEVQGGYHFSYKSKRFLRNRMLKRRVFIKPNSIYNALLVEKTYSRLNRLGAIKFSDIFFVPMSGDTLECHISLSKGKLNTISAEIEGTYTANDWGVLAGFGYANKNIFGGAEVLSLHGKGSYEWRQGGGRALGIQGNASLQFPNSFKVDFLYDYQSRPEEYERNIANIHLSYTFQKLRSQWIHSFRFIGINYVYLPWISETFRDKVIAKSNTLKHTYENHFIVDIGYSGSYSSQNSSHPYRNYVNVNYNIELAGNMLYVIAKSAKWSRDSLGAFLVGRVPFSQYVKGDIDISYHHYLHPRHQLVYHVGVGVAVPYLNSDVIPFERRYFSGGSRVRGWKARQLGPGIFPGKNETDLNSGDIRFDMNIEYRWNFWNKLELALFTDAGNIWTIKDYAEQPGGKFKWNEFYKQLAWGYGIGLRYNFNIVILTLDFGIKLHDPGRILVDGKQWRTARNGLNYRDDMYLNFGIGYPF